MTTSTQIGYARCSTDKQDLTAQREALVNLGVNPERVYTDHGLTGRTRARPGLGQALVAARTGDTLVVTKLDRLARSTPDARQIADGLAARGVRLALGATVYDPTDPMGKMFFNILATFAEFESDLIKMRTREGMKIARAKGKLRGKKPKLSEKQHRELRRMYDTGGLLHQRPRRHLHRLKTDDLPNSQTYRECQLTSMNKNAATWVWLTTRLNRPTHGGHASGSLASQERLHFTVEQGM